MFVALKVHEKNLLLLASEVISVEFKHPLGLSVDYGCAFKQHVLDEVT